MDLGERKLKILAAVIEAYIQSGEPVGSKALVELLDHAVSSATIRNDMADLAAEGYLEQPHTSAGRIPTAKAFRLYIDSLMRRQPLNEKSRHEIEELLSGAASDPERLIEEASQALAEVTGCAAVTTTPDQQSTSIRRIEVLRSGARTAALLLMTSSGMLRSRVCRFDSDIDSPLLERLNNTLSAEFLGQPLSSVSLAQVQTLLVALGEVGLICAPALTAFVELVQESAEAEVLLSGQLNLLRHPDYELERARSLLSFLSQRDLLAGMLTAHSGGLRVVLGSESPRPELDGSSIIVTRYSLTGGSDGSIGIIGPLRMDYAATIPRLEYFAQTVSRLLHDLMNDG
jgi:heat-inducible transcriptional repressor